MSKLATAEVVRKIGLGDVDLDEISEVLRTSELAIKSYRNEVESLRRNEEDLKRSYEEEQKAVDDLTKRLATIHEDNRLAREVFCAEIEGRKEILGVPSSLDLEALDMCSLINERENVQRLVNKTFKGNRGEAGSHP
ncbi:hypothetical protein CEE37_05055 [candidate division LCP-89 bacterium B3_LCP]|uniref:Uncharacterized protein n=1 Tax=candidate division LCP-89 bacterium B3_LCP TaxID=2012998 RepID=A0A532V1D9_UNCL8|nr:MAG: hypothetical protein CEE37_05055 [candidate division LCP-89 bacterium B3_LCP]